MAFAMFEFLENTARVRIRNYGNDFFIIITTVINKHERGYYWVVICISRWNRSCRRARKYWALIYAKAGSSKHYKSIRENSAQHKGAPHVFHLLFFTLHGSKAHSQIVGKLLCCLLFSIFLWRIVEYIYRSASVLLGYISTSYLLL